MASSLFSNTVHIFFDSVLAMDNPGMVLMFEALMASGLKGFIGCPAVLYEAALVEFFENASVRGGVVISTVGGKQVATVRSELLDFRAKAEENHLNLSTQLGFLFDYINRGGDDKKGKVAVASDLNRLLTIKLDLVEAAPAEKVVTVVAEDLRVVVVANEEEALVVDQDIDNTVVALDLVLLV
ncbi:putative flavin-containing monooxygenase 1 [Dorcoceras hygrometricum]|uniref:Putative flavin-containing monooxygenase 1 n=1 Tax=Dorcoceras hygrometricum TaxID=472368 RepID=A0A2Z7CWT5_9LAMI|nr:putative flavin-containing monooxygenase 1 [Dorcoceras hygrometricum]